MTTAAASASRRDRRRSVVCEGRGGADEGQRVPEEAATPPIHLLFVKNSGGKGFKERNRTRRESGKVRWEKNKKQRWGLEARSCTCGRAPPLLVAMEPTTRRRRLSSPSPNGSALPRGRTAATTQRRRLGFEKRSTSGTG
jgi:hypothetical protein